MLRAWSKHEARAYSMVAGTMINLLCFADVMVLLAPFSSELQILKDKLDQEALAINMTFNVGETVCMIFKPVNSRDSLCNVISFQHSLRVS